MLKYIIPLLISLTVQAKSLTYINSIKVSIVDTGLDINDPRFKNLVCDYKDFTGEGITDTDGHGTHVAGLIKRYAGKSNYCLIILKYYSNKLTGEQNFNNSLKAFKYAVQINSDIVNFSGGGPLYFKDEYNIIKNSPHTLFVAAVGNDNKNTDNKENRFYPACYFDLHNVIGVGALNYLHQKWFASNYGKCVKAWEVGQDVISTLPGGKIGKLSGTSMSTAIKTGKLVRSMYR